MQVDELALKLKVDQSQVGPELQSFNEKVHQAMGGAHKSFIHVESEGRTFKKLIHEIAAESPLLGQALRLAINPVTGILMSGVMALKAFSDSNKEAAKTAKESAEEARKAWVAAIEAIYSKDPKSAFAKIALGQAKGRVEGENNPDKENASLASSYFSLPGGQWAKGAIEGMPNWMRKAFLGPSGEKEWQAYRAESENIEKQRTAADKATFVQGLKREKHQQEIEEEKRKREKELEEWEKRKLEGLKKYVEFQEKQRKDQEHRAQMAEQVAFQKRILGQQQFSDLQPTLGELANSGWWTYNRVSHRRTFHQTPWAQQAGYIERLEAQAKEMVLWGNVSGAKELMFGKGGIRDLKGQLEQAGLIKPEIQMEKMQEHLQVLAQKAAGEGLNVSVKGGVE